MPTTTVMTRADLVAAVRAAVRAPSLMNTQPWRFRLRGTTVELLADPRRRLPVADPTGWGMRIACGAALFNLRVAYAIHGTQARVTLRPDPSDPNLMARVEPGPARPATPMERQLYAAIDTRHSNRSPFWPDPVPADVRARLVDSARAESGWLELVIGSGPVAAVAEVAHAASRVLHRDPAYRREMAEWTRREPDADGVPVEAGGPSPQPYDLLPNRPFSEQARAPGRDFEPEPLVAVLGTAGNTAGDQLTAGQALQRVLLTATNAQLAVQMLSQPIEVVAAREQLRLALGRFGTPQMVMRIGYGQPGSPTPRRPVEEVIEVGPP
jgi:nitroreductase